jgi:hypothetical protein
MKRVLRFLFLAPLLVVLGLTQADQVYLALNATETTETILGTIKIPTAGVRRIVGVYGCLMQPLATSGETVSGWFRLAFTTISGTFKFPAQPVAGAAAAGTIEQPPRIIPVDILVPPNETVTISMAANKALTGTGEGMAGIIME